MFTMSKLTKKDKIHIFEEWTLENKRGTYLSKKYGIRREKVNYLINLIKIHGLSVLDKSYTHYSKEYKEHAIKRVLLGNESINAVALDLGLPGNGMLSNWIRYVYLSRRYLSVYTAFFYPGEKNVFPTFFRKEKIFYSTEETEKFINSYFIPARRSIFVPWEEIFKDETNYIEFMKAVVSAYFHPQEEKELNIKKYIKVDYQKSVVKNLLDNLFCQKPVALTQFSHWPLITDSQAMPLTAMYHSSDSEIGMKTLDYHELHGFCPYTTSDSWSGSEAQQLMVINGSQIYVHSKKDSKRKNTKTLFYLATPQNVPDVEKVTKNKLYRNYAEYMLKVGLLVPAHLYYDFKGIDYDFL